MSYGVGPAGVCGLKDIILDSFPAAYSKGTIEICSIMGSLVAATKAACREGVDSLFFEVYWLHGKLTNRHGVQIECPGNLPKHLGLAERECCRHLGCLGEDCYFKRDNFDEFAFSLLLQYVFQAQYLVHGQVSAVFVHS
jgi:hypothetical protein